MLTINFTPFPILITERLQLRRITAEDDHALYQLRSNQAVMKYLDRPLMSSIQEASEFIEKINSALQTNDGITWGISLQTDPRLIGTIGFWRVMKEHHRAEIGYMLYPGHQGKGLMQEALSAVLHFGFENMRLHSVEANVNPENTGSIKILEKNRFEKEAWFKENYFYNGKFLDSFIYSLLTPHR